MPSTSKATEFVTTVFEALAYAAGDDLVNELDVPQVESVSPAGDGGWLGCDDAVEVTLADGRRYLVRAQEVR